MMLKIGKYTMLIVGIAVAISIFPGSVQGGALLSESKKTVSQQIAYTDSAQTIANPERGFYKIRKLVLDSPYNADNDSTLDGSLYSQFRSLRKISYSLVEFQIDLGAFAGSGTGVEQALTEAHLAQIQRAFDLMQQNGLKAVMRIAYDFEGNSNPEPEALETVLYHIDQLKPVLTANADLIYVMEAGMLGPYGEWHSSRFLAVDEKQQVLDHLLDSLPENRSILLRRPQFYRDIYGGNPLTEKVAFSQRNNARIGFHNDAFLSTENDMGTYRTLSREEELDWLDVHTQYVPFGGEAIRAESSYNDFDNAIYEMQQVHCQYLNGTYDVNVKNKWKGSTYLGEETAYWGQDGLKYIEDHLGYRFVLKDSRISASAVQGGRFFMELSIENTGFGNLLNTRQSQLVLEQDGVVFETELQVSPRDWNAAQTTKFTVEMQLPSEIGEGDWNIYLRLPDQSERLRENHNYNVRFANPSIFNETVGGNYIGNVRVNSSQDAEHAVFQQVGSVKSVR